MSSTEAAKGSENHQSCRRQASASLNCLRSILPISLSPALSPAKRAIAASPPFSSSASSSDKLLFSFDAACSLAYAESNCLALLRAISAAARAFFRACEIRLLSSASPKSSSRRAAASASPPSASALISALSGAGPGAPFLSAVDVPAVSALSSISLAVSGEA